LARLFDIDLLSKHPKLMAALSTLVGLMYLAAAGMQVLQVLGVIAFWFLTSDIVVIFLLVVLAAVFLGGVSPLRKEQREAIAFPAVGLILAALLFVLKIVILLTNAIGCILSFDDWQSWSVSMDFEPTLWTFPIIVGMFALVALYSGSSGIAEDGVDSSDS
jgi:hypothetical protein